MLCSHHRHAASPRCVGKRQALPAYAGMDMAKVGVAREPNAEVVSSLQIERQQAEPRGGRARQQGSTSPLPRSSDDNIEPARQRCAQCQHMSAEARRIEAVRRHRQQRLHAFTAVASWTVCVIRR